MVGQTDFSGRLIGEKTTTTDQFLSMSLGMLRIPRNMTWLESGPEFCTRPPLNIRYELRSQEPNTSGIERSRRSLAPRPRDNREPRNTACMRAYLCVCARTAQRTVLGGKSAQVPHMQGERSRACIPVQCTARSSFGHTADQTARLWLTGRDTCTTSWCAPRTMHESDRLPN